MTATLSTGSYTRTGFSHSFGCCSRWQFCDMGKKDCFYKDEDPAVKNACNCYRNNHKNLKEAMNELKVEDDQLCLF